MTVQTPEVEFEVMAQLAIGVGVGVVLLTEAGVVLVTTGEAGVMLMIEMQMVQMTKAGVV